MTNEKNDNYIQDITHLDISEVFEDTEDEVHILLKYHRCAHILLRNFIYVVILLHLKSILYIINS